MTLSQENLLIIMIIKIIYYPSVQQTVTECINITGFLICSCRLSRHHFNKYNFKIEIFFFFFFFYNEVYAKRQGDKPDRQRLVKRLRTPYTKPKKKVKKKNRINCSNIDK